MDPMLIDTLQAAVVVLLGGFLAYKSQRTDKQTRRVGNGFADEVTDKLDRISRKQDLSAERMERIESKLDRNSARIDRLESRGHESLGNSSRPAG